MSLDHTVSNPRDFLFARDIILKLIKMKNINKDVCQVHEPCFLDAKHKHLVIGITFAYFSYAHEFGWIADTKRIE